MFDNLKFTSKELNIAIRCTIYLPENYDHVSKEYDIAYLLAPNNPFLNANFNLELSVSKKDQIFVAIYPNMEIAKNKLLFESYESSYNYSKLYSDFIVHEIKPIIEEKYRTFKSQKHVSILGYKDTAILAYTLANEYTGLFGKVLCYGLDVETYKSSFLSYIKSVFDPNISLFFNTTNSKTTLEIYNTLIMFGIPQIQVVSKDNLDDLVSYL